MNRQFTIFRNLLISALGVALSMLASSPAGAQTLPKAAAELAAARGATINGNSAISGMTIFNNNRVKTGQQGNAIVNAGKSGRVELGSETDLTLGLLPEAFGGELRTGRAVISVPAGVVVSVTTPKGIVTTDGTKASALIIEINNKQARIICHKGDARLVSGNRVERIQEGEEIAQASRSDNWQHRNAATGALITAAAGQVIRPVATAAATSSVASTLPSLVGVGISASALVLAVKDRSPEQLFDTSISCRDNDSFLCQRRSPVTP